MDQASLQGLFRAALANAKALLQEASLLLQHGHYSRAYLLAVASIEETGKAAIAHDAPGRNLRDQAVRSKIDRMITDHASKIRAAFTGFLVADPDKNAERAVELIVQLQRGREPSMYTEIRTDGSVYSPSNSVSETNANDCIRLADRCFRSIENHIQTIPPRASTSMEDRFFALRNGETSKIMNRSDFSWYYISRLEQGEKDLASAVITYKHDYLLAGKEFEKSGADGAA